MEWIAVFTKAAGPQSDVVIESDIDDYPKPPLNEDAYSIGSLPRFYQPKSKKPVLASINLVVKEHKRQQKSKEGLSNQELEQIWTLLKEYSEKITEQETISSPGGTQFQLSYDAFCKVAQQLPYKCRRYFKSSIFTRIPQDTEGLINASLFFNFIVRCASLRQERACISFFDSEGSGHLQEKELEDYIADLVATFPGLKTMDKQFLPFYLCGAVRKFFFFLDHNRRGRVAIRDILLSPILTELFENQQSQVSSSIQLSNWFSLTSTNRVYGQYVELDANRNGMLDLYEMQKFSNSRFTEAFIERVFQENQTFGGELDYKNYLDFVLVMNHINHSQSLRYLFKAIDANGNGFIDLYDVNYFLKAMKPRTVLKVCDEDFINEIFDMANPREPYHISLDDLLSCGSGGNIISLLIDVHAFMHNQFRE